MKRLADLTMNEYIRMLCGETDVLKDSPLDICSKEDLSKASKSVIYEYSKIADSTTTRINLNKQISRSTEILRMRFLSICLKLMSINAVDDVRSILKDYGLRVSKMTDIQLIAEIKRLYLRCASNLKRMASTAVQEEHESTPDEIRSQFDKQAASLMTYFKFQIDLNTIKATTFAYMIQQANREIKARMAALNKH